MSKSSKRSNAIGRSLNPRSSVLPTFCRCCRATTASSPPRRSSSTADASTTRTEPPNDPIPPQRENHWHRHESATAAYLTEHVDDRIERAKNGAEDRGDFAGMRIHGGRLVGDCKDYSGRIEPGPWLVEAEIERGNDDALAAFVVAKRRGITDPGRKFILLALRDLVAILTGVVGDGLPLSKTCDDTIVTDLLDVPSLLAELAVNPHRARFVMASRVAGALRGRKVTVTGDIPPTYPTAHRAERRSHSRRSARKNASSTARRRPHPIPGGSAVAHRADREEPHLVRAVAVIHRLVGGC
ncbi:hypothetical protein ACIBG0_04690 [Nocardia sp. NPDC050630]|uniref:hypothetical protein n=1 Tax=Nocardia sp. NPDC050630 TaxID=3364321 RepID=UPI003789ED36